MAILRKNFQRNRSKHAGFAYIWRAMFFVQSLISLIFDEPTAKMPVLMPLAGRWEDVFFLRFIFSKVKRLRTEQIIDAMA